MRKFSVLLLAFLMVGGFAFGLDVELKGDATLTWGIDLQTESHGFKNDSTGSLKITLVPKATATKGGDGIYGWIEIKDYELTATPAGVAGSRGAITARIMLDEVTWIQIFKAPGADFNKAAAIDEDKTDVKPDLGGTPQGFTFRTKFDPITLSLKAFSDGDWETGNSVYGTGVDVTVAVDPLTIDAHLLYGYFDAAALGVGTKVTAKIADVAAGLETHVSFDGWLPDGGDFVFDAGLGVTINLFVDGGDKSFFTVTGYYNDEDIDLKAQFSEHTAKGLMPGVGFGATLTLMNLTSEFRDLTWKLDLSAAYDQGGVNPYVKVTTADGDAAYDFVGETSLEVGLNLKAAAHGIDNTTFSIVYESDDVSDWENNKGLLTFATKISY